MAYAASAGPATILIAACVVVTAILTPLVTAWAPRMVGRDEEEALVDESTDAVNAMASAAPFRISRPSSVIVQQMSEINS